MGIIQSSAFPRGRLTIHGDAPGTEHATQLPRGVEFSNQRGFCHRRIRSNGERSNKDSFSDN